MNGGSGTVPLGAPPATRRVAQVDDYHGTPVTDSYRWLEDNSSAEVQAWIDAQNLHTQRHLGALPLREEVARRLQAFSEAERRVPVAWRAGHLYCWRQGGSRAQPSLVRQTGAPGPVQEVLDVSSLSPDGSVSVPHVAVSADGCWLAYACSEAGSDWLTWRVRDLRRGEDLPDRVPHGCLSGAAWLPDGSGFFYGRGEPKAGAAPDARGARREHQRLCLHRLGQDPSRDIIVAYDPARPDRVYAPRVSDCGRWLVVSVWWGEPAQAVIVARLDDAGEVPVLRPLLDESLGAWFEFVGTQGGELFFLTDAQAPLSRVIAVDPARPGPGHWREVEAASAQRLEAAVVAGPTLVLQHLHHGASRLSRVRLAGGARPAEALALPDLGTVADLVAHASSGEFFFSFQSVTRAPSLMHQTAGGALQAWFEPRLAFDAMAFETVLRWAVSADGTRVPYHLTRRRSAPEEIGQACLLTGYGGFGLSLAPRFQYAWLDWLERGGAIVQALVRGGGEYGRAWHEAARGPGRQRAFDDFIAVAEALVAGGLTHPGRLAIHGASNGGLLVAACMLQRPELFAAAVPAVGLFDMLRYQHFTLGARWVSEYGRSENPGQFRTLLAYSPLHNVVEGRRYPATLLLCGDHDDRVVPWHSYKFAAALQHAQGGTAPILLRVARRSGHGAGKPRAADIAEKADMFAFLLAALRQ